MYSDIWERTRLPTRSEQCHCRYAVAVVKSGTVVGRLPKKLSRIYSLFIRIGGVVRCRVAGRRRYSDDLPQGGLEIPCVLILDGKCKDLEKVKRL